MTEAATFTDAELFNCWPNGENPSPEEIAMFDALEVCGVRNTADLKKTCTELQPVLWTRR